MFTAPSTSGCNAHHGSEAHSEQLLRQCMAELCKELAAQHALQLALCNVKIYAVLKDRPRILHAMCGGKAQILD